MKYVAVVKNKETGRISIMEEEYNSKKEFKRDIRNNGYSLMRNYIWNKEDWDDEEKRDRILNELEEKKEMKNIKQRIRNKTRRELKK